MTWNGLLLASWIKIRILINTFALLLHEPSLTESLRLHNYISAKAANGRNLSCNIYFFPFLPLFIDDHKVYIFFFVTKPYPKRDAIKNYWGLKRKTGYFYRLNSGIFWDVCVCVCVCVCVTKNALEKSWKSNSELYSILNADNLRATGLT